MSVIQATIRIEAGQMDKPCLEAEDHSICLLCVSSKLLEQAIDMLTIGKGTPIHL